MSDWDDDEPQSAPTKPPPRAQYNTQYDNGWNDEPASFQQNRRSSGNNVGHYNDDDDQQSDQISFAIGKKDVGLVIGRGGSKIKELERKYNVRLEISE